MSRENVEVVRRALDLWNAGMYDGLADVFNPEIEIHGPFSTFAGEPYRGIDGARKWMTDITEQFDLWQPAVDEIRAVDDNVVLCLGMLHTRGRASGVALDRPAAIIVGLRAARISRLGLFQDAREALKAVGLEE